MKRFTGLFFQIILAATVFTLFLAVPRALAATIIISEPNVNVVNTNSVVVKGYIAGATTLKISVNGYQEIVYFDNNGFFAYTAENLRKGANLIRVSVSGSSGSSSATKDITVIFDDEALIPQFVITNYSDNAVVSTEQVFIQADVQNTDELKVKVNGSLVNTVNLPVGLISVPITLNSGSNTIAFEATKAGTTVTTLLHLKYTLGSLITDLKVDGTSVNDYMKVTQDSVLLTASADPQTTVYLKQNGIALSTGSGGSFSKALQLSPGGNTIEVTAKNSGTEETRTFTIYYGMGDSQVYNIAPIGTVYTRYVTLTGTVRNADSISIFVNGNAPMIKNTSQSFTEPVDFSYSIALLEGNNTVYITAKNNALNHTETFPEFGLPPYNIYYESKPIVIIDTLPQTPVYTNSVTVTGRAFNASGGLTINGQTTSYNSTTGEFTKAISLKPGVNSILVTAKNSSGQLFTFPVTVDYRGGPNISNLLPESGTTVTEESLVVSGVVSNTQTNGLKLLLNDDTVGTVITFGSTGSFNQRIDLAAGNNTLTFTATDGSITSKTIVHINYDNMPVITVGYPLDNAVVTSNSLTITGKVFNTQDNGLVINGDNVSFNKTTGSFSKNVVLENVVNTIELSAVNGTQVTTKKIRVNYSGLPQIQVTSPQNGDSVESQDIIIEGTVFPVDQSDIKTFTINKIDSIAAIDDGTFRSVPITLGKSGDNKIELVLETKDSRKITQTLTVKYNDGPIITIWSPVEDSTVYSNAPTISGKVTRVDSGTFKIGTKTEVDLRTDGTFNETITLNKGKNEIKLSASYGAVTSTKTITLYYSPIAQDGAEVESEMEDGGEVKAFDDMVKIKLEKGSVGEPTTVKLSVSDPSEVREAPQQSAFVGPLVRLGWEGDKPAKNYKLTLVYDDAIGINQSHKVAILYNSGTSGRWQVLGGVVDPQARTVSIKTNKTGYFVAAVYFLTYDDTRNHWAERDIEFLTARGAITGDGGKFLPDKNITRAEFVTLLVKALGMTLYTPENHSYNDVREGHWAYETIETALRAGIVSGVSHRNFAPDRYITRQEAGALMVRAGSLKLLKVQELTKVLNKFIDNDKIDLWAQNSMATAIKAKILNGDGENIFPKRSTTKAQAAAMISRLAEKVYSTTK